MIAVNGDLNSLHEHPYEQFEQSVIFAVNCEMSQHRNLLSDDENI